MCKGLFEDVQPRHSIEVNNKGKAKKVQDSSKENNILCTNCENRISILETYFARKIIDIHNYNNIKDRIDLMTVSDQQYLIYKDLKPTVFKIFVYSLVWRSSISSLHEFEKYKIEETIEEELRIFLNENLAMTQKELFINVDKNINYPSYDFCVIKPVSKNKDSRGIFTAFQSGEQSYLLMLVDFAIYFFTHQNTMNETFKFYSNRQNEKVIIAMGDVEKWKALNQLILDKMFEK